MSIFDTYTKQYFHKDKTQKYKISSFLQLYSNKKNFLRNLLAEP